MKTIDELLAALKATGFDQPNILIFESGMCWLMDFKETKKHFPSQKRLETWITEQLENAQS